MLPIQHRPLTIIYSTGLMLVSLACFLFEILKKRRPNHRLIQPWQTSWLRFLLFVFCLLGAQTLFGLVVKVLLQSLPIHLPVQQFNMLIGVSMQLGMLLFLLTLCLGYKTFFGDGINSRPISNLKSFLKALYHYAACLPLILLTSLVWIGTLMWMRKRFHIPFDMALQDVVLFFIHHKKERLILSTLIVFACVIAPITEELIFRAGFYRFLKGRWGDFPALIVSSIIFAALHQNWTSFVPLCLLGMLLTRLYEHFGNLKPAIFLHAIFNTNTMIFLILQEL